MTRSVSNVVISTDTFYGLILKTNELLGALSNEIVTSTNSVIGSNTSGNVSVLGIVSANIIATPVIRGGNSGNTATLTTLAVGHSNSTTSSNVRILGYTANISSNTLNVLSNTVINTTSVGINVATFTATGNTTFNVGNTSNPSLVLSGNTTYGLLNVVGANAYINTASFYVASVSSITGNTVIKSNSSITAISVSGDGSVTNTTIGGDLLTVAANITATGTSHAIGGNVAFDSNTLFIDSVNNRVGIFTGAPEYAFHVKNNNASPIAVFEHIAQGTKLDILSSNAYSGGNTIVFDTEVGNNLRIAANGNIGTGYVFIAANGNIGLANDTPGALVSIGNTRVYSNGTMQTSGDLICSGDLYANIVFMGGTSQATVTATVCPIVPPNTIYSAAVPGPYSFLQFSNTTPQIIDFISKAQGTGYQAVKYTLQIQDNEEVDEVVMTEVSMVYGYGNAHSTQYGTIYTNSAFIEVSVGANSTDYWIQAAPTSAYLAYKGGQANIQFRGVRQKCR